jgi:outer membrane protein
MKISATKLAAFSALLAAAPSAAFAEAADGAPQLSEAEQSAQPTESKRQASCQLPNSCKLQFTGEQVLAAAERAIAARDFDNAMPLVEALGLAPEYKLQHRFLKGFIAAETGNLALAEETFRKILNEDPLQTRVRLELARVMLLSGKEGAANYHFRLAQQDEDLPEEIRKTVSGIRGILRNNRAWNLNFDVGIAPDTNINSATSAESVNVNFGPFQLPLTLDENARKKSGIGQTAGFSAGLRIKATDKVALLLDSDVRAVNYAGEVADNYQLQLAAGPELRLGESASVSLQAIGEQRWYGGQRANTDFGGRIAFQHALSAGQRIGLAIDGRNTSSGFSEAYSGWQVGGNVTYEQIVARSFIASASLFGRRDLLESEAFSNVSYGASLGIGGELPLGINAGVSGNISQAVFDAPILVYSPDRRKDLRLYGRAYMGIRAFKLLGFSPSIEYNFSQVDSNHEISRSTRHRANFKLARFF